MSAVLCTQSSDSLFWVPVVMQLILQLIMIKRSDRYHHGTFSVLTNYEQTRTFVKSIWLMLSKRQYRRYNVYEMLLCFLSLFFVELR